MPVLLIYWYCYIITKMDFNNWPKNKNGRVSICYNTIKDNGLRYTTYHGFIDNKFNFYFEHENKRVYFKSNSALSHDYNEILAHILAKGIGFKNFVPVSATFFDEQGIELDGIVSQDYVKDRANAEVFSYWDVIYANDYTTTTPLSVKQILEILQVALDGQDIELDKNFESDLKKCACFIL